MEAEVTATRGKPRGLVRVNAGTAYAKYCLVPTLPAFHARYPEIEIELGIDDRHVDVVAEQVDVAVRTGSLAEFDAGHAQARRRGRASSVRAAAICDATASRNRRTISRAIAACG